MCHQELIAYQCGHRSMGVIRPCPLTTAAQNLKVCAIQPTKQYNALTMCVACERTLHFRWVLVREWEHRWLHERGVCECDVKFPGLLHRPRVSGYTDLAPPDNEETGKVPKGDNTPNISAPASSSAIGTHADNPSKGKDSSPTYAETVADSFLIDKAKGKFPKSSTPEAVGDVPLPLNQRPDGSHEHGVIPQTYSEMTVNGEHRVAIRVPGLYAAEWLADHRTLHTAGECECPVNFTPFQPSIVESGISSAERELLRSYHEFENNDSMSRQQIEERVAEITRLFGGFVPIPVDPTKANNHHLSGATVPEVVTTQKEQGRHVYVHMSQLATSPHEQALMYHQARHAHGPSGAPIFPGDISATYTDEASGTIPPNRYHTQGINMAGAVPNITGVTNSRLWLGTSNTATNPQATSFWLPNAQSIPGSDPPTLVGPGPFTTTGLDFTSVYANNNTAQQGQTQPLPLCGLPVGAGPEGDSHMPHWSECRLSHGPVNLGPAPRPRSSSSSYN